jgi:mono/diheme cytochrome c family protein
MLPIRRASFTVVLVALAALGCGGGEKAATPATPAAGAAAGGDLTPFQVEHGIGPITEPLTLPAAVDEEMAEAGKKVFETKCSACHKMGEKYVGPALGEVTTRRTPAFILNMILNPQEMIERHPVTKQLVAEMMSFMPNQGLTQNEARQVLEYLRTQSKGAAQ